MMRAILLKMLAEQFLSSGSAIPESEEVQATAKHFLKLSSAESETELKSL